MSDDKKPGWYHASEENKQRARERAKAWYLANPEKAKESARKWRENNPAKRRAVWIKHKYKLTDEQYEVIQNHNGLCDSCGIDPAKSIDHDHDTGRFRGMLCQPCNTAEGMLRGDPARARALAEYMERVAVTLIDSAGVTDDVKVELIPQSGVNG